MFKFLKTELKVRTPTGFKTFTGIQKYNKKTYNITTSVGQIETAELHRFVVDGKEIFAKDLKVGDLLQTIDSYTTVLDITEGPIKDVYDLTNVDGEIYYTNGILSHNTFHGSSATLINGSILKNIVPAKDEDIIFNSIFEGLRIFEEPQKNHHYILTMDPKKDGADEAGVHVFDVTTIPFVQVASANLAESYITMPGKMFDLGTYYNNAMFIGENNIDNSILDAVYYSYEYEGEVFREKTKGKSYKNILGFRTTTKTKRQGLSMMKKFIEEGKLIIKDKKTLSQLFNFIEKKNGSFSAEDSYFDDLVMSMMLVFAPFLDIKSWDDFKGFIHMIEKIKEDDSKNEDETLEFLDLGFGPDDASDEESRGFTPGVFDDDMFIPSYEDFDEFNDDDHFSIHNPDDGEAF